MKTLKKILLFIINPFSTFGIGKSSDKVAKTFNKNGYLIYILAFVVTIAIIFFTYFLWVRREH